MYFTYFKIHNFRGIKEAEITLHSTPQSKINTLVGLNESGKTTLLEAINHFTYKTETLDPLKLSGYKIVDPHSLIPISQRANFNGEVSIEAGLELEPEDEKFLAKKLKKKLDFRITRPISNFMIRKVVKFKNSRYIEDESTNFWTIVLLGLKPRQQKARSLQGEDWENATEYVTELIPSILYFPNFLFEFPNKIYLEDTGKDDDIHEFYRLVLQDILDALDNDIVLETHILERAKSDNRNDKKSLDGLLLEMGRNVTTTVFQAWHKIFHQDLGQKRVVFSHDYDSDGHHFLQVKLEDSDGFYTIGERSLGFRWFFVFLLLTQYRGFRKGAPNNVLFLFDEPASNLHSSAQGQLLKSFENLSKKCRILYTTHSHYLINPNWLEQTFVVKNEGLDYTKDTNNYNARKTNITVTRYRKFVSKHPDQTNYYKPILDVLDYCPSQLENVPNVVMIEGKNDFYLLHYLSFLLDSKKIPHLLPGTSAGGMNTPIQLYLAWGRKFVILLDSDSEGKAQKARYIKLFGELVVDRIFCLEDVDSNWKGYEIEKLFPDKKRLLIQQAAYPDEKKYHKTHFNRAIQELLVNKRCVQISDETKQKFGLILSFLEQKLSAEIAPGA